MKLDNMYEGKDIRVIIENSEIHNIMITNFSLKSSINKHKKIILEIEISDLEKRKIENLMRNEEITLKIELKKENYNIEIFNGLIEYFEIVEYGSSGSKILIKSYSKSILLDRENEKKYRVFQDINLNFSDIIDEINKDYIDKKINVIYEKNFKKRIGQLIIQYNETDWEFIVRMASYLGLAIIITEQGLITVGSLEMSKIKEELRNFIDYSIVKEKKNFYYKVKSKSVVSLGDFVKINENINEEEKSNLKKFIVFKSRIYLENYILRTDFIATDFENYKIYKKYNNKIKGCTIEGSVEKVFEENNIAKMEVRFYEGLRKIVETKEEGSKAYEDYGVNKISLSYQTFYSQTNTGFFCTPEINDTVEVYFPNESEEFAKVSWAINNNGNGRFSNYEKRNFHINGKDFNIMIDKNKFEMNIEKSYTRNSNTSNEIARTFVNKGKDNMIIVSDNYMGIESIGEMSIYGNKIDMIGKEKDIRIETKDEIRIKGKKIHTN